MKTTLARLGLLLWVTMLPSFSSRALTTLYSFTNGFDGAQPYAGLALGNEGNFYGTSFGGGTNALSSCRTYDVSRWFAMLRHFSKT